MFKYIALIAVLFLLDRGVILTGVRYFPFFFRDRGQLNPDKAYSIYGIIAFPRAVFIFLPATAWFFLHVIGAEIYSSMAVLIGFIAFFSCAVIDMLRALKASAG